MAEVLSVVDQNRLIIQDALRKVEIELTRMVGDVKMHSVSIKVSRRNGAHGLGVLGKPLVIREICE